MTRDKFNLAWISEKTGQVLDDADKARIERNQVAAVAVKTGANLPPVKGGAATFFNMKDKL